MKDKKGLSPLLTLGLAGLLCLLFALTLLPMGGAPAEKGAEIRALAEAPERTLVGADEPDRPALELLPGEKLDLNSAGAEELRRLPGIGDKLSAAIVSWREEHGPFRNVEDLLQVPGIGQKRLEEIRELVTVNDEGMTKTEKRQP